MRKIIAKTDMSLDGVIEDPQNWTSSHWTEEWNRQAGAVDSGDGPLLLGRRTYEGFAAAWPNMEDLEGDFAVKMNNRPKYVVTSTLDKAEWTNTTIVRPENVVAEVTELKNQAGDDILMYGYGPLAHELLRTGLLDELQVWVYPVLVGSREVSDLLFRDGNQVPLKLAGTRTLGTGVVILTYLPAK